MIYDIIELPYRYEPLGAEVDTRVTLCTTDHRFNEEYRQIGEIVNLDALRKPQIYRYKIIVFYGDVYSEITVVTLDQLDLLTLRNSAGQYPTVFVVMIRQYYHNKHYVFRHIPSILHLRTQFGINDIYNNLCTTSRYILDRYAKRTGRIPCPAHPYIDDFTVEGAWPPEHLEQELNTVEEHLSDQYLFSHICVPMLVDDVTLQIASSPVLTTGQLLPLLHLSYGSRGYRHELTLTSPYDNVGMGTIKYSDLRCPREFYDMFTMINGIACRDLKFTISNSQYEGVRTTPLYLVTARGDITQVPPFNWDCIKHSIHEWICSSYGHISYQATVVKSWTDEMFITVYIGSDMDVYYIDSAIFGLCTHTLTSL